MRFTAAINMAIWTVATRVSATFALAQKCVTSESLVSPTGINISIPPYFTCGKMKFIYTRVALNLKGFTALHIGYPQIYV